MTAQQYAAAYEQSFHIAVGFFLSRGIRHEDAVERVQAAWVRGWEKRDQLREPAAVLPWIISIAKNLRSKTLLPERATHASWFRSAERAASAHIDAGRILDRSRSEDRRLLKAHYLEGFTVQEMAEASHVSPGVLESRLYRARRNALLQTKPRPIGSLLTSPRSKSLSQISM